MVQQLPATTCDETYSSRVVKGHRMRSEPCPIWGTAATISNRDGRLGTNVDSARAGGEYFISSTASAMLKDWDEYQKNLLTSWLIEQRRRGTRCPEISGWVLDKVARGRPPSVHERADNL